MKILVAGDRHVLSRLMVQALKKELGDSLDVTTIDFDWPMEPHVDVAEVREAAGGEEEIVAAGRGAEVIVTQLAPITRKVLNSLQDLKLVVVTRGGPVNVNVEAATENGVIIANAPGRNAPAAAEYALGLMLAAMKRIPDAHASLKGGEWRGEFYAYEENGIELDGSTVGLVGFGAIGSRVAKVLAAFGAEVLVHDPFVEDGPVVKAGGRKAGLDELLERSKVVSLHARLSDETRGMIGAEQIGKMPEGSVLVNTARGGLLDYDALCDALESGQLGAAALDVYEEEPPPEGSRLFAAPNLVLSPHIAGATRETAHRAADIAAAEVGRYARGEKMENVVNGEAVG
ncbi:hydroxyacid dehydrogenase [Rubrobacter tropicus]|uniref:Hydroxyacid dehydrogenase n=1 Tax=Rubrobacter tropicus TaxID=2653851 RepID=A0A6G8Q4Y6_9ACTN|nr:2-hydroxyacid dehydrogenase [Rubrobacter tropicus]QIN81503.1 hydroxyacid dehydrogenase [Rubrobacter tropicus]